jgi:hypothetical protein
MCISIVAILPFEMIIRIEKKWRSEIRIFILLKLKINFAISVTSLIYNYLQIEYFSLFYR